MRMATTTLSRAGRQRSRHHGRTLSAVAAALLLGLLTGAIAADPFAVLDAARDLRSPAAAEILALLLRGLRTLAGIATLGALAVATLLVVSSGQRPQGALMRAASRWGGVWFLATAGSMLAGIGSVAGGLGEVPGVRGQVALRLLEGEVRGLFFMAWAAALVAFFARRMETCAGAVTLLVLAGAGLLPVALTGHSAHAELRTVAVISLAVHVLAVSLWVGGLLALAVHSDPATRRDGALLRRFSSFALACYVLVAASGVVNVLSRLSARELLDSGSYGLVLATKVGLFVVLGGIGYRHRTHILRGPSDASARRFWALVAFEVVVMAAAVGLGVLLATTAPTPAGLGQHVQAAPSAIGSTT